MSSVYLAGDSTSFFEVECAGKCADPRPAAEITRMRGDAGIQLRAVSGADIEQIRGQLHGIPDESCVILLGGWNSRQQVHWDRNEDGSWQWRWAETWAQYQGRIRRDWSSLFQIIRERGHNLRRIGVSSHGGCEAELIEDEGRRYAEGRWVGFAKYYRSMPQLRAGDGDRRRWRRDDIAGLAEEFGVRDGRFADSH